MKVMKSRLLGQKNVLETGLAEYTSLEVDSEKQVVFDNYFDFYALFSKGFGNAVMTEEESSVWTTGEMPQ